MYKSVAKPPTSRFLPPQGFFYNMVLPIVREPENHNATSTRLAKYTLIIDSENRAGCVCAIIHPCILRTISSLISGLNQEISLDYSRIIVLNNFR